MVKNFSTWPKIMGLQVLLLMTYGHALDTEKSNLLNVQPVMSIISINIFENPVVSIAYERAIGKNGISLYVPMHVAYQGQESGAEWALGGGIGVRKYINSPLKGVYFTGQVDYIYGRESYRQVESPGSGLNRDNTSNFRDLYLIMPSVYLGYRILWSQFTFDFNFGGAFYATHENKFTQVYGGINLGFPFDMSSFGR